MIAYLPELYPDELVYSWFSRYFVHSGYTTHKTALQELFGKRSGNPSREFIGQLNANAERVISGVLPMRELIFEHTMFPQYARFLPHKHRQEALNQIEHNYCAHHFLFAVLLRDEIERCFKYCPICAQEDRERYGETYWHRTHQIHEISICPEHHCYLETTNVSMRSKVSSALYPAETEVPFDIIPVLCDNDLEIAVAQYVASVFLSRFDMESTVSTGMFLCSRLEDTKYCLHQGKARGRELLYHDVQEHYKSIDKHGFTEQWQLSKLLIGTRHNFYEVCLLARFLGIQPQELAYMTLPAESQHEQFDRLVHEMRKQGLRAPEISRQVGSASVHTIKAIGAGAFYHIPDVSEPRRTALRGRGCAIDWSALDTETLPRVVEIIPKMQNYSSNCRPHRVTPGGVSRLVGLKDGQISKLPKCLQYIHDHTEPSEVYYARCVIWAYTQLTANGERLTQTKLQQKLNTKKQNIIGALPHLERFASPEIAAAIRTVIIT